MDVIRRNALAAAAMPLLLAAAGNAQEAQNTTVFDQDMPDARSQTGRYGETNHHGPGICASVAFALRPLRDPI